MSLKVLFLQIDFLTNSFNSRHPRWFDEQASLAVWQTPPLGVWQAGAPSGLVNPHLLESQISATGFQFHMSEKYFLN